MQEFPIYFSLPGAVASDYASDNTNRVILKRLLDHEWTFVCVLRKENFCFWKPHSIKIHRKNIAERCPISVKLSITNEDKSVVWEKNISKCIDIGSSFVEIDSNMNGGILLGTLHGVVNISYINDRPSTSSSSSSTSSIERLQLQPLQQLSVDFGKLLDPKTSCFSDVILKCGEVSIPAHKAILSARSPVFAAMFAIPSPKNEVSITDIDVHILWSLVLYLYTGKTPEMTVSLAEYLLFVADKYKVQDLKMVCSNFLKDTVSLQSALRLLFLGDVYATDLRAFTIDYICNKCDDFSVLEKTEEWSALKKERPDLTTDVLTSLVKSRDKNLII